MQSSGFQPRSLQKKIVTPDSFFEHVKHCGAFFDYQSINEIVFHLPNLSKTRINQYQHFQRQLM